MKYGEILEKLEKLNIGLTNEVETIHIDNTDNEIGAVWNDDGMELHAWSIYSYRRWPEREALAKIHAALPPLPTFLTAGELFNGQMPCYPEHGWWDEGDGSWLESVLVWEYVGDTWW